MNINNMTALERLNLDTEIDGYIELLKQVRKNKENSRLELGVIGNLIHRDQKEIDLPVLAFIKCVINERTQLPEFSVTGRVGEIITDKSQSAPVTLFGDDAFIRAVAFTMTHMKQTMIKQRQKLSPWFTQDQLAYFPEVVGWYIRAYH